MFYKPGDDKPTLLVENGICPLCGGNVNQRDVTCENCGKLEYDIIFITTAIDDEMMNTLRNAAKGDADEQMALGWYYETWSDLPYNQLIAKYWYEKAAEQGNANAQANLAIQYLTGRGGVEENYEKAKFWTEKAAEQGWVKAQANLGQFYLHGAYGVEQNIDLGIFWTQKAAEQGHKQAQFALGQCYLDGTGVVLDEEQAIFWLEQSAKQGFAPALELLAEIG